MGFGILLVGLVKLAGLTPISPWFLLAFAVAFAAANFTVRRLVQRTAFRPWYTYLNLVVGCLLISAVLFAMGASGHVLYGAYVIAPLQAALYLERRDSWSALVINLAAFTLVTAPEPPKAIQFFQEVLEFRVSEMLVNPDGVPVAAWLWQRPSPHDIAIVPGGAGGFHHAAFVVESAEALFRAADILTMHKARIDYGPSRHGITRGYTTGGRRGWGVPPVIFFPPLGGGRRGDNGGSPGRDCCAATRHACLRSRAFVRRYLYGSPHSDRPWLRNPRVRCGRLRSRRRSVRAR